MLERPYLRALSISEILDASLRIYRANFIGLLSIAALALIPEGVLEALLISFRSGAAVTRAQSSLTSFFTSLASMALIVAISNAYLGGNFTIGSAYSKGLKRFWSIIGARFLMSFAISIPAIIFAFCLLTVATTAPASQILFVGIIIILLPVFIFLFTRWSLVTQAIILEDIGASDGIRRTWNLTDGHFWRVLATSFAASLLAGVLTILPTLVLDYALGLTGLSSTITQLVDLVAQQLALILTLPFTAAVQVLIYYDLRIRKEGFDLLLRTEEQQIQPA
jgi:hypothetical protein